MSLQKIYMYKKPSMSGRVERKKVCVSNSSQDKNNKSDSLTPTLLVLLYAHFTSSPVVSLASALVTKMIPSHRFYKLIYVQQQQIT